MIHLPEDLLDYIVFEAVEVGGDRHLKFTLGDEDPAPNLRALINDGEGRYTLPEGCWNLVGKDNDLGRLYTVARIDGRWWYLGDWDIQGHAEARRCGYLRNRAAGLPQPRFVAGGHRPWVAGIIQGSKGVDCPDCENGYWPVASPKSGVEARVRCPRCDGKAKLSQRAYVTEVRQVEIGAVKVNTGAPSLEAVEYSSGPTGYGTIWHDWKLFDSKEEAEAMAEILVDDANEELERREKGRALERELWVHSYDQAEIAEAKRKVIHAECDLDHLRRRVMDLIDEEYSLWITDDQKSVLEDAADGAKHPDEPTRELIAAWILDNDDDRDWYLTAREEKRQEDCSC